METSGGVSSNALKQKKTKRSLRRKSGGRNAKSFRLFTFVAALVVAVGWVALSSQASTVWVVTATKSIPALTQGSDPEYSVISVSGDSPIEDGAFSAKSKLEAKAQADVYMAGKWYLNPVLAGQQIRKEMLTDNSQLAVPLAADERMIAIGARAVRAVAAMVKPGDKVDIYVSRSDGLTGLLGQNIEIVSVSVLQEQFDSAAAEQFNKPTTVLSDYLPTKPVGGTYIIRVSADDVAKYIAADVAGILTLSLHGVNSNLIVSQPVDIFGIICPDVVVVNIDGSLPSDSCTRSK
jgi:Flp pilus assembly protein CpaB